MAQNVPKRSQLSTINCNDSLSMTANTKLAIPALKSAKIASVFFSLSSSFSRCCLSHAPHASHIPCCSTATADSICHRQAGADAGAGRRLVARADSRCKPSTRQSYRAEGGGAVPLAVQSLWAWHGCLPPRGELWPTHSVSCQLRRKREEARI